jgi:hypothetical protein
MFFINRGQREKEEREREETKHRILGNKPGQVGGSTAMPPTQQPRRNDPGSGPSTSKIKNPFDD